MSLLNKKTFVSILIGLIGIAAEAALPSKGEAEHVVLIIWDGMRPDFVTPQHTPTLFGLATNGVFFKNHHASYISSTKVNGAAIATGCYPEHNGIYANSDYRQELGWMGPNATEGLDPIRRADFMTGGNYMLVPTAAEIIQKAGFWTAIAGAKPVIILHDRSNKRSEGAAKDSVNIYRGQTIPKSALETFEDKVLPTNSTPNIGIDNWTYKNLTQSLWKKGVPRYSVLWLSEPDASQHAKGVGADEVLAALTNCDKIVSSVIKTLKEKKVFEKTDIIMGSDHGFSTIRKGVSVTDFLKKARFKATTRFEDPEPGDVLVVPHGGSVSLYVWGHDEQITRDLAAYLQTTDFAGVIFSRVKQDGVFPLDQARIANTNVLPDIVFSMRWSDERNDVGAPGLLTSDGGGKGGGTHASLSRFDMHNTLLASGPDFKKGYASDLPSGSIDIAPTTLWILGIPQPKNSKMDGRVLQEALVKGTVPSAKPETKTIEATATNQWIKWSQYLKFTQFENVTYFDEGNASVTW